MPVIVRITSADGKRVMSKLLPALPSRLKVPAGARVDVIEKGSDQVVSLGRYINEKSNHVDVDGDGKPDQQAVQIETSSWEEAEAFLSSMEAAPSPEMNKETNEWFVGADKDDGHNVLGFEKDSLLIGGLIAGAVGFGVYELTKGNGTPKDTIAPTAPTALDLAAEDDSGSSSTDNITKVKTGLTISGTAEAGASVELFNGTVSLGKVTASATGAFSKDVDLAAGTHSITARATDNAGNVSVYAVPIRVVVDETAPTPIAALDLAAEDDTGHSGTDNITTRTTGLTITGTTEANATVELFDGTTSLGVATASATGTFSRDIALAEGTHTITAKATDAAGNVSDASPPQTIVVDTTLPFAPDLLDLAAEDDNGASNTDNKTTQTTGLTITGRSEIDATVDIFDGVNKITSVQAGANGLFTVDLALGVGTHFITAKTIDVAGNVGPSSGTLELQVLAQPAASLLHGVDSSTSNFG